MIGFALGNVFSRGDKMAKTRTLDLACNHLLYGDCLDNLKLLADESVDLIYLDPPFKSDTDYNMLFGSETGEDATQIKAFTDTWYWHAGHQEVYDRLLDRGGSVRRVSEAMFMMLGPCGMLAYILFMTERLIELHRVLKQTGSLYLHCDPTASHYLKLVLDAVFGAKMFQNEIIWQRMKGAKGSQHQARSWGTVSDNIYFYTKSDDYRLQPLRKLTEDEILEEFKLKDEKGQRYKDDSAHIFRNPSMGVRPNLCFTWRGFKNPHSSGWRLSKQRLEEEYIKGNIIIDGNRLSRRKYLKDYAGKPLGNVWVDINIASGNERLGYPTQKPLALLKRIIEASSNEGDIILDPFCGCGTAVDAAQALGRHWIGMDVSALAINVIIARLEDVHGPNVMTGVEVTGIPTDVTAARMLFNKDPFDFERWAVGLIHARPNDRQTGDSGSDGELLFPSRGRGTTQEGIVSVKGGANITPSMVRDLRGTVEAMQAVMGVLILMEKPTRGMINEAAKAGLWADNFTGQNYPKLQIITIEALLSGIKPDMPTPRNPYTKATYRHSDTRQGELL